MIILSEELAVAYEIIQILNGQKSQNINDFNVVKEKLEII